MRQQLFIGLAFGILLLLLNACDKDDFSIERTEVEIHVGETLVLGINHANGNCTATAMNPAIIETTVRDGKLELFATDEGTTIVHLTDGTNRQIEIRVVSTLYLKGMWRIENVAGYQCSAYAQDIHMAGDIWSLLENKRPYSIDKPYVFVREGESVGSGENIKPIYYQFENGKVVTQGEEGDKHTYTIIQCATEELILLEDFTEYFNALYPNARITSVMQKITWTRYRND